MNPVFVVFAKAPEPGQVKTRLGASIGAVAAARAHQAFIADTFQNLVESHHRAVLAYAGDPLHSGFDPVRALDVPFVAQPDGDLGARMLGLAETFLPDHDSVIFLGTDSPTLPKTILNQAVDSLKEVDVVVGPSFDGGYYLLGLKASHPRLFEKMPWSTPKVFGETLARAAESGLQCDVLPFWYDVDVLEDFLFMRVHLERHLCQTDSQNFTHTLELIRSLEAQSIIPVP